jgi:hypothetical protein
MHVKREKYKITNRILKYLKHYSIEDLSALSLGELLIIQEKGLVKLILRSSFRNRHLKR